MGESSARKSFKKRAWCFNPRDDYGAQLVEDFFKTTKGRSAENALNKSFLGQKVRTMLAERDVALAEVSGLPFFGHYIPYDQNMSKSKAVLDHDGLILLDKDDVKQSDYLYLMFHEFVHALQDPGFDAERDDENGFPSNRLLPMQDYGVLFNTDYKIEEKELFVRMHHGMEAAADIIALKILCDIHLSGDKSCGFIEYLYHEHTKDIANTILDCTEFARANDYTDEAELDLCLFMAFGMARLCKKWSDDNKKWAEVIWEETKRSKAFDESEVIENLGGDSGLDDFHFLPFSSSYSSFKRVHGDEIKWAAEIESYIRDKRTSVAQEKAAAVNKAFATRKI